MSQSLIVSYLMQLPYSENSNSNDMQLIRLLEGVLFSPAYRADPNKNQKALYEKSLSYSKSVKSSQIPEKREEKSHQDLRRKKLSSNVGQGSNPGSPKS